METITDRINQLLKELDIKQTDVARRLKISNASVSNICSGKTRPSGQTVTMLCREFGVNDNWLTTGEGSMFISHPRREEVSTFLNNILHDENDFKFRFIQALSRLENDDWARLEQFVSYLN